ncbi:protein PFC0760c-like [Acyrthosiphon pisum]|uniref:Uncharacterized protein n=1 Tax=Acyrthosiphon pisum TaxID=7029 RepID=A0A8R2B577_ACYPI|nr:protein PFC0760c-like [Acyrthosiphon pisum]XP_008182303.1 protein PFC0760c-like [Acyrthosiphon pisum]|eukprot:XP_003243998.1 PREDICTED: protein PFC0760c-like [Acyrthosiphon pisum]
MSCNQLRDRQQNTLIRRIGIATVNRNCLSQSQHTALLSTPKGWTPHGLSFIIKKCRKTGGPAANGRRRETGKYAFFDVNTTIWPHFVKQFLQSAEYNLAPATRIILKKILPSRVNFSDPKWSSYRNTQTELCQFLSNLNPDCDSINWKGDFFRNLTSLTFNYMVQVLCSGRISKKQKMAHVILKKINNVTNEYVLLNSPDNFLQGVQIFVANMLSPWLEKPINYICSKVTSNKDSMNKNMVNEIENQKIGIETKDSKTNELSQNKTNGLKLKTAKKSKINQKSKIGKFTKTIEKRRLSSQNSYKATKIMKTNRKSKKGLTFSPVIAAVDDLEKIIENHEILSNSVLVRHPVSKNTIKKKMKNNKKSNHFKSENNQKSKKSKSSKTFVKSSLYSQNSNIVTKTIKTNGKSKKDMKFTPVIAAVDGSEKIIENHNILSNSLLVRRPTIKTTIKKKIKNNKKLTSVIDAVHDSNKIFENHEILSNSVLVSRPDSKYTIKKKIKNNNQSNHIKSENNQKSKKSKISKTIVKGSLSLQNHNKATKKKINGKLKKGLKSATIVSADDFEKISGNNQMLSNSVLAKHSVSKKVSKRKVKGEKNSNILEDVSNTNGRGEYTNVENGNNESMTGNEKSSKSTKQLQNDDTFEADSNGVKKNKFINDDVESLRPATDAENSHAMIDTTHDGRKDDGQRTETLKIRSKSHYDGDDKMLLSKHGDKPTTTIPNRITDSQYYNANEDDGVLNVTDYSKHSITVANDLFGENDINILRDEALIKYNDKTSIDVDDDSYSDVNTDYDNGFDDDDGHRFINMNEDGEEFESRILDDLANVFLNSSLAGWSNKHEHGITATESRGDEAKRNCFQICSDGFAQRLLMDTFRNKALIRPEVFDQSTGVAYNICKKDGSNYSVRKTILPQSKNRNLQCTTCALDKSKLVVNTLIELKD